MRAASDIDRKQKLYFLSRFTCVGVNTITKLHGMGVETLLEGHIQTAEKLANSCLKIGV